MTLTAALNNPRKRGRRSHNTARPQGRVQPFRDRSEIESTPWITVAMTFAEAVNLSAYKRLESVLVPDVTYTSDWSGTTFSGRKDVMAWFRFRLCRSIPRVMAGGHLNSQIVVLPDGCAAVLTAFVTTHEMSLTTFEGDGNVATHVHVTTKFNRRELRETLYCPPEG